MWSCAICGEKNDAGAPVCRGCQVRRGGSAIDANSLFVTHATSGAAFERIRETGFEIRAATAGRSLGDVIYGYAYDGGSMFGSLQHAVGVCRERGQRDLVVLRIAPKSGSLRFLIFNQPRWEQIIDQPGVSLSNYQAYLDAHPGDEGMVEVVRLAKTMRLREITDQPYSWTENKLKNDEAACRVEMDRLTAQALAAPKWEQPGIFKQMDAQMKALEGIELARERLSEKFKEDHLVLAAKELGFDGFYNLGTHIIVFFDPTSVACQEPIFACDIPEVLLAKGTSVEEREAATIKLLQPANEEATAAFASFLGRHSGEPEATTSYSPSLMSNLELPPSLIQLGSLASLVLPCPSSPAGLPGSSSAPLAVPQTVDGMQVVPIPDDGRAYRQDPPEDLP